MNYVELVGYLASMLVIISFLTKNMTTLRIVNSFGCMSFIVYGIMLQVSYPIIITNTFILMTHAWYYVQNKKKIDG